VQADFGRQKQIPWFESGKGKKRPLESGSRTQYPVKALTDLNNQRKKRRISQNVQKSHRERKIERYTAVTVYSVV